MKFTEEQLVGYSKPISNTEETKCINAIRMISDALKNIGFVENKDIQLAYRDTFAYETVLKKNGAKIKLLVQGSYANNTNVKTESDIDIAVIQENVFTSNYREGVSRSNYNFIESDYNFKQYKKDIYSYLIKKFGSENVSWENKYLLVKGNTYRVDADTVPARRNRDYTNDFLNNDDNFIGGISIIPDTGEKIINYPEQHIKNGRDKNNSTNLFYKKMVRIIKKIRYIMIDEQISSARNVNSFVLESLLWNVDNYKYINDDNYKDKFQGIVNYLKFNSINKLDKYKEANGIKKLCKDSSEEKNLENFINDLYKFFNS